MPTEDKPSIDKLVEYHYNAYKNLIQIALFLNAAGITAVMATLGLKYKQGQENAHYFANPHSPIDVALNSSLEHFLLSILMIIICAITEYLSYWPRRKKEKLHNDGGSNCCFHDFLITACVIVMLATIFLSYFFLIYGGIEFKNMPFPINR